MQQISDAVDCLLGFPTSTFVLDENGCFVLSGSVQAGHPIFFSSVARFATMALELNEAVGLMATQASRSQFYDAFGNGLGYQMMKLNVEFEQARRFDLKSFQQCVGPSFEILEELHSLVCQCNGQQSVDVISALFERWMEEPEETKLKGALGNLVAESLWPISRMISRWLEEGILDDPCSEFFICSGDVRFSQEEEGEEEVVIDSMICPGSQYQAVLQKCPRFLQDLTKEILFTGSYVALQKRTDEKNAQLRSFLCSEPATISFNALLLADCVRQGSFDRFKSYVFSLYHNASKSVWKGMHENGIIDTHMQLLDVIVFNKSGVWEEFFSEYFDVLCGDSMEISAVSRFVEFRCRTVDAARETFRECFHFSSQKSEYSSCILQLTYLPPSQIQLVVTPKAAAALTNVFHWLFRVRWLHFFLNVLGINLLQESRKQRSSERCDFPRTRAASLCRQLLHHFDYHHEVLSRDLRNYLTAQNGVDECRNKFENYCDDVARTFLLAQPTDASLSVSRVPQLIQALEEFSLQPTLNSELVVNQRLSECVKQKGAAMGLDLVVDLKVDRYE